MVMNFSLFEGIFICPMYHRDMYPDFYSFMVLGFTTISDIYYRSGLVPLVPSLGIPWDLSRSKYSEPDLPSPTGQYLFSSPSDLVFSHSTLFSNVDIGKA
jgi:hypothetical protein